MRWVLHVFLFEYNLNMDISYNDLKTKEIVNLCDGSKMGHVVDILFDSETSKVSGIVAPGEKRIFKKSDDVFIPIEKIRRIGDDVILVRFDVSEFGLGKYKKTDKKQLSNKYSEKLIAGSGSYIRYRKLEGNKYK